MPVLVIDDNLDVLETFTALIELAGFEVLGFTRGTDALGYLDGHPPPCLVFLDLIMPDMEGGAVLKELRRRFSALPIYLVTGYMSVERLSAFDVPILIKPVDGRELFKLLHRHCPHRKTGIFLESGGRSGNGSPSPEAENFRSAQ